MRKLGVNWDAAAMLARQTGATADEAYAALVKTDGDFEAAKSMIDRRQFMNSNTKSDTLAAYKEAKADWFLYGRKELACAQVSNANHYPSFFFPMKPKT